MLQTGYAQLTVLVVLLYYYYDDDVDDVPSQGHGLIISKMNIQDP